MLCTFIFQMKIFLNNKVLLRERKRHTARRVASTRHAVPVGVPPSPCPDLDRGGGVPHPADWGRGYPFLVMEGGTPPILTWDLDRGVPHPADRGVPQVPPIQTRDGGTPHPHLGWSTPCPHLGWGNPPPSTPGMG